MVEEKNRRESLRAAGTVISDPAAVALLFSYVVYNYKLY